MTKFHFQRFEFVLLRLWLIILTFLVCFSSNQCPLTTSQCSAMYALNTSLNLPTSITNYGSDQTNPCKNKLFCSKNEQNLYNFYFVIFFLIGWFKVSCSSNQVTQIYWFTQDLAGTIPTEIGLLTSLRIQ